MNILAFFAHPDDETMLCGGTLALLTQQSATVDLLIATRGEGGEMGEPPICTREALGAVREAELRCAARALGIHDVILMPYIDPLVGPDDQLFPFSDDLPTLVDEVVAAIHNSRADVLLAHGINGEYGHPAHKLVHQAAWQAVQALGADAPLFYSVQGHFADHPYPRLANADAPADFILDVHTQLPQKTEAAMCHRSQHALFVRGPSKEAGRLLTVAEAIIPLESLTRVWPAADDAQPHDALADLLLHSGQVRRAQ